MYKEGGQVNPWPSPSTYYQGLQGGLVKFLNLTKNIGMGSICRINLVVHMNLNTSLVIVNQCL